MQREENSNSSSRKSWRGVYFDKLYIILSVLLHIFLSAFPPCFLFPTTSIYSSQTSPLFSPSPILHLHLSTPRHSLFLPCLLSLLFFFFFFFYLMPLLLPMSVVLSRALLRQIKRPIHLVSSVLRRTGNVRSLLSSVSTDSHLSTLSSGEQIRSELGQVTQWWINGRWPWVRIYRTGWGCSSWNLMG